MKLYDEGGRVAALGTFSPNDYMVLPEHKKVFIDHVIVSVAAGTSGKAGVWIVNAGQTYPIEVGIPITESDTCLSIPLSLHLEVGMGIRARIENLGAADDCRFTVFGVK